jgi:aspartate/methionine/tyrosine aminotransferase
LLSLHYQESNGGELDRYAAAAWLAWRLEGATSDRIVVTGGAQSALFAVCDLLLSRGDVVLAGAMTYPGLKAVAAQKGTVARVLCAAETIADTNPSSASVCTTTSSNSVDSPTRRCRPGRAIALAASSRMPGQSIKPPSANSRSLCVPKS